MQANEANGGPSHRRPGPDREQRRVTAGTGQGGMLVCPLCGTGGTAAFARVGDDRYHRCDRCALVFVDPSGRLDAERERERYETHENDPGDPRYRAFLDRLAVPLVERLDPGARGLDYGSGPGPTLSVMLGERGFPTDIYDPFFAPDTKVLDGAYDFVTCTETAEHFFEPGREFARFDALLRPGGWLGLMTGLLTEDIDFETWWYVRDPTHVAFYAPATLRWIADRFAWHLETPAENVALFRKPATGFRDGAEAGTRRGSRG